MPQNQHYMPQAYLRQWCDPDRLVLYRRLAVPPKLLVDRKAPKSIAYEVDLHSLPPDTTANNKTGNDVEVLLGNKVDQRIAAIVARTAGATGKVSESTLERDVVWLMKTFVARSPKTLAKMEAAAAASMSANRVLVERMIARAATAGARQRFQQFKDPRMPQAAARAALIKATEVADLLRETGWLDGDVHVLHARDFTIELESMGAREFVTFEDPVVEWGENTSGVVASFALSPDLLVVIAKRGTSVSSTQYAQVVRNHVLDPIPYRENLICRSPATGDLHATASNLRPTTQRVRR